MRYGWFIVAAIGVALFLAAFVSPWASRAPDGLDRVALDHGFMHKAEAAPSHAPAPGYAIPGLTRRGLSTGLAGLAGTVLVLAAGLILGHLLARRGGKAASSGRRR